jgi:hypothetical protein
MEIPQVLQTVSEISIAFAGFSGLVVALRKNPGPLTNVQKYRLRVLLALAFGAMFLSMLPELLMNAGASPQKVWIYSSALAVMYSGVFLAWWLIASRRMMRLVPEIFSWFAVSRMATGHLAAIILLLATIASLFKENASAAYIAALIWYLMHAAQQFSRMLFIQPRNDGPGDV